MSLWGVTTVQSNISEAIVYKNFFKYAYLLPMLLQVYTDKNDENSHCKCIPHKLIKMY